MIALRALGYLWSLPYGVVGLLAAVGMFLLGWCNLSVWRRGTFQVLVFGPLGDRMSRLGWGGFTLGWTVLFWRAPTASMQRHEERHVGQALVLGVLFLPVYGVIFLGLFLWRLAWSFVTGHTALGEAAAWAYQAHPLERDARNAAARISPGEPSPRATLAPRARTSAPPPPFPPPSR